MEYSQKAVKDLIPYINNARTHSDEQVTQIASSIREFGFINPIIIDDKNNVIAGHGRLLASKKLGLKEVPTVLVDHLTDTQRKAYVLADNQLALNAGWDDELLKLELAQLDDVGFDLELLGFDLDALEGLGVEEIELEEIELEEQAIPEPAEEPISKLGDLWTLGNHRLMCGDSTSVNDVEKLTDGQKADLAHNDPPYGMKKEKDGVKNDNLNYDDLLDFNKSWIALQFTRLKDNGSFYCWGIDEPLMDIYSNILKPYIKTQKATFRNLITWDKGSGQGQMRDGTRMYPPADEKCLFVMCGVQGFNNNCDNYYEGWEGIRAYLEGEAKKVGLTHEKVKQITGVGMYAHWFTKSQWVLIPEVHYKKLQDAFKKDYDALKKDYYSTRAYFDNTHDNMNNVWHFARTGNGERELTGGHATPKPIDLCERVIKSSSPAEGLVIDFFGGSGSTLIACEKTKRNCFMMELDPKYCDVIIKRWQNLTGNDAVLESTGETYNSLEA